MAPTTVGLEAHVYRLLDQAAVIRALTAPDAPIEVSPTGETSALGGSPMGEPCPPLPNESQARSRVIRDESHGCAMALPALTVVQLRD